MRVTQIQDDALSKHGHGLGVQHRQKLHHLAWHRVAWRGARRRLTDAEAGDQLGPVLRHGAHGEEWLQEVGGKHIGDDVLGGRSDDEELDPQLQERRQGAVHLQDVGVIAAGFRDGRPQLRVAQGTYRGEDAAHCPHYQRQGHRAGLLHHAGGGDEDARAYDSTDDDGHAVHQSDVLLQGDSFALSGAFVSAVRGRGQHFFRSL